MVSVVFRLADTLLVTPLSSEILFLPMSANVVVQGMYQRYSMYRISVHGVTINLLGVSLRSHQRYSVYRISVHGVMINLLGVSLRSQKSILFKVAMSLCQIYLIHV